MYILVIGNPIEGFRFVGVFASAEQAAQHGEKYSPNSEFWIARLELPEDDQ